ncbi:MAG: hypothetical protein Q8R82_18105 [Hyphomonadaceae bacterium]|nr:hypothetical protein [Hyphomonadaceae bacterium]
MTRIASKPGGTRVTELRAGLRAAADKPRFEKAPPKAKKIKAQRETIDERAEKAERQALLQHTTSLLNGGKSSRHYVRVGERAQRKGTILGLVLQLAIVVVAAGGIAYALDPTILPAEWSDQAHGLYKTHIEPHVQTVTTAIGI